MSYQYDFFLSYSRSANPAASEWVRRLLAPALRHELQMEHDTPGERLFLDEDSIEPGAPWPELLAGAALRSKVLVAVLSPPYFRSHWCVSELDTFLHRDAGARRSMVVPLQVWDGDHYREDVKQLQLYSALAKYRDYTPDLGHRIGFKRDVRALAQLLRDKADMAPPFDLRWRAIATSPEPASRVVRPSFA